VWGLEPLDSGSFYPAAGRSNSAGLLTQDPKKGRHDFRGIDDTEVYIRCMTDLVKELLASLSPDERDLAVNYQQHLNQLQDRLHLIPATHLLFGRSQADFQTLDIEERLKLYIPGKGLHRPEHVPDQGFDLKTSFEAFLANPARKAYALLGQGGSGKSLFTLATFKRMLQHWQDEAVASEKPVVTLTVNRLNVSPQMSPLHLSLH
jgi:hypothetical protein